MLYAHRSWSLPDQPRDQAAQRLRSRWPALLLTSLLLAGAQTGCRRTIPAIEFTQVPEAAPGGPQETRPVAGRVRGAKPGQKVVLFAKAGMWFVQPFASDPFTNVQADATWQSITHRGTQYAALLVEAGYRPPHTTRDLPQVGQKVLAVAATPGISAGGQLPPSLHPLRFSGYEWEVQEGSTDRGGVLHSNRAENVWTDAEGALHLRIVRERDGWSCGELSLGRSLGYGSYSLTLRARPRVEAATVFSLYTWDPDEAGQNHREMSVDLSQWGEPENKNAQFTIQPYYVAANVYRYVAADGPQTHTLHWEPGQVLFRSVEHSSSTRDHVSKTEHVFTSGVPSPGGERVHINLCSYGLARTPQQNGTEVVIESFEYLP